MPEFDADNPSPEPPEEEPRQDVPAEPVTRRPMQQVEDEGPPSLSGAPAPPAVVPSASSATSEPDALPEAQSPEVTTAQAQSAAAGSRQAESPPIATPQQAAVPPTAPAAVPAPSPGDAVPAACTLASPHATRVSAPTEETSGDPTVDRLNALLREMVDREGSDLHIRVGEPPIFRIHGSLVRSEQPMLSAEDAEAIMHAIMNEERREHFEEFKELDMSYSVPGLARFRVNVFRQSDVVGAVLRVIPFNIKGFDDLGLPAVAAKLCEMQRGLVLVTGPTGSGKSTTLAAMIDYINTRKRCHIITIEDPIEFLHQDKMGTVNQRELGADTHAFADALRHVMRQNPDVILVGELRDLETISQAITAAETGHLVFATLHTTDAAQTIDRVIDVFPPDQQQQVRLQLSTSLAAVVSQTLLPTVDGHGRVAAFEILICHSGVRNIIREGKTHQIYSLIQTGSQYGMQLLDQNLKQLLQRGVVSFDDVIAKSSNPGDFEHLGPN